jgi:hypothetical protein
MSFVITLKLAALTKWTNVNKTGLFRFKYIIHPGKINNFLHKLRYWQNTFEMAVILKTATLNRKPLYFSMTSLFCGRNGMFKKTLYSKFTVFCQK